MASYLKNEMPVPWFVEELIGCFFQNMAGSAENVCFGTFWNIAKQDGESAVSATERASERADLHPLRHRARGLDPEQQH
jgi:hypothetical protein